MQESKVRMSGRLVAVLIVVAALMLGLAGRLFYLQGMQYEYYLGKVLNNIQQESVIPAERGSIYDANGNLLATNLTTWRVFISPSDIQKYDGDARLISDRLAEILSVDAEEIYEKSQKANRKDETVKRHVEKAAADEVRAFIAENKDYKQMIHLEATNKRYYPCGQLACQVIGVMGTDRGLSGLELYYDEKMKGTDGVYRYARNGMSQSMPTKYETYIDAKDGYDIHTTLDVNIQRILEEQLKSTYEENKAEERVCGIVMDVKTGGILAMATYPTFDLNDPYTLVGEYAETFAAENLEAGSEEYNRRFWELVYTMWNNKAITDTYNPGSTFKIVTSAAALNEGVITPDSMFTCTGRWIDSTGTTKIACARTTGHGTANFTYMLQQSCNPTLIQTSMLLGKDTFWKYFVDFGFTELTGIDLPGEAHGINYLASRFTTIDLAVSAFGQGFKTTPLQEITAISAVAGGGALLKPHLVDSITDKDGNVVWSFDGGSKRQIVSAEVCRTLTGILADGVSGDGGARNAYVAGYDIAAKTGTSEKKDKVNPNTGEYDLRVGSCVGYAPAEDPQVSVLIVVDEPNTDGKSSRAGGVVAAPYIAGSMAGILPYLGVDKSYTEEERQNLSMTVGDYSDKPIEEAKRLVESAGIECEVVGNGPTVLAQLPANGENVSKANSKIILYTASVDENGVEDKTIPYEYEEVPDVVAKSVSSAITRLTSAGFSVYIKGAVNYDAGSGAVVASQTHAGETLPKGSVVTIECVHTDVDDAA